MHTKKNPNSSGTLKKNYQKATLKTQQTKKPHSTGLEMPQKHLQST